ncbi:enoyl-CoA hydratase/carnithine racemase [Oxalobacteraceae bacterium GrIS 2.11]
MTNFIHARIQNQIGFITLDRPKALNSLSLEMIRSITATLRQWKGSAEVRTVFIHGSHERAFCAGGDIRFFYDVGTATPQGDSALLEDFFTEEYALNYLIHTFPKPYISLLNGVVMGGGMGIAQSGTANQLRIVTEKTKMAMPEVNIGLFPDVGGGYFLSRCAGELGSYLGLTGNIINAADAIYAQLADVYLPSEHIPELIKFIETTDSSDLRASIRQFAAALQSHAGESQLQSNRQMIDRHFSHDQVIEICRSLKADDSVFAQQTYAVMQTRSPLLMCVTLEQLRRSSTLGIADCLRLERSMVRHCFKHGEVLEGVRALVVDKDGQPAWRPANLEQVNAELIQSFFDPVWPDYAHPLRELI